MEVFVFVSVFITLFLQQAQDMLQVMKIVMVPGALIYFGIGVLAFYGSVVQKRKKMNVKDFPTSNVRSLALGPVELKGKIRKKDQVFESPFSKTPCVMYTYSIAEYQGGKGRNWVGVESGKKATDFYLDDGTGKVLVDPEGAEFEFEQQNQYTYRSEEPNPQKIDDFLNKRNQIFENNYSSKLRASKMIYKAKDMRIGRANPRGMRRYTEEILPLDTEQVYVFGEAMKRNGETVINTDDDSPGFKISDKSESEIISDTGTSSALGIVFGLFFFMVPGFVALIFAAGLIYGVGLALVATVLAVLFNEKFKLRR